MAPPTRPVAALAVAGLVTALSGLGVLLAALVLAYLVAGPTGSLVTFAAVQTVVALLGCLLTTRSRAVAAVRGGLRPPLAVAVPAVLAFLVWPVAWSGRALLGWQLGIGGPAGYAVDLLLWCGAVGLGLLWAGTRVAEPLPPRGGYA